MTEEEKQAHAERVEDDLSFTVAELEEKAAYAQRSYVLTEETGWLQVRVSLEHAVQHVDRARS